MSTTIKPLEVYIKGTKVFPDVDLSGTMLSDTSLLDDIISATNEVQRLHMPKINLNFPINEYPYIMPPMEDGSASNWHSWDDGSVYSSTNYWCFGYTNLYDIQFDIDAAYVCQSTSWDNKRAFNSTKVKTLNFKGTMHHLEGYSTNDWSNPNNPHVYSHFFCKGMFSDCVLLEEINGLVFDSTQQYIYDYSSLDPNNDNRIETYNGNMEPYDARYNYAEMFRNCTSLRKLDITWPTESNQVTLHGDYFNNMFSGCWNLPDNQVPTFKLVPMSDTNCPYGDNPGLIDISEMFMSCPNITSIKITNDSWQYIFGATSAFNQSGIHSIDIPATATNLKYVRYILGYNLQSTVGTPDWSDSKFVIRTTAPMDFYINGITSDGELTLFNYGEYDNDQTFINDFGGIYVPDSQLNNWKTMIANQGGTNIAQNCVFGISQL